MKKWLAIVLCLVLVAALTACGAVTRDEALAAALKDAGLAEGDITMVREMQEENEFYFEFHDGKQLYIYEIEENGKIETKGVTEYTAPDSGKDANTDPNPDPVPDPDPAVTPLTREDALKKAYAYFEVAEADAKNLQVETEREDGREVWDIEFDIGTTEYNCEIDINTGEVVSHDIDRRD